MAGMTQDVTALASRFFDGQASFVKGCVHPSHFPELSVPEVAFIGRSNVGKSSLINALLGRRGLARTSNTPGRTREINYFYVAPPKGYFEDCQAAGSAVVDGLYVVDLPGYGYAKAKKDIGSGWEQVCAAYLSGRSTLKRAFVLVDSRHGLKPSDREICGLLDRWAVSYQLVLTKGDKIKKADMDALKDSLMQEIEAPTPQLTACFPEVLRTSSLKKAGMDSLKTALYRAANPMLETEE